MQKGGIGFGRMAVMVGFALSCFGLLLFLWLAFGGPIPLLPKGYRVQASFNEATQLAVEADVRVSGVPVGKVKTIEPDRETGRSDVVMEIRSEHAPLHRDVKAILRQKTLLGETYVELTPGTPGAGTIAEMGRIPTTQVSEAVQLDEIFRAFDPKTRQAFQSWLQTQARAVDGRGRDISDALGNLGPFAEDASEIVDVLNSQEAAVQRLVSNTGEVFSALTERDGQLRGMIESLETVFATTARRDAELQETFRILPTFQRESRQTLGRLDDFAVATDPLVDQLRPAARELSPTLADLEGLAPDLKALFGDLGPLINASREGFPAAERLLDDLKPFLQQADPASRQLIPILAFVGLYKREITAFFANVVAATQATDQIPGRSGRTHYLRTTNPVNAENLAVYPRRIGSNRTNPYPLPGMFTRLREGLLSFETRHCGRGVPVLSQVADPVLDLLVPRPIQDQLTEFFLPVTSAGQTPAPPCIQQPPYSVSGELNRYPQVKAAP